MQEVTFNGKEAPPLSPPSNIDEAYHKMHGRNRSEQQSPILLDKFAVIPVTTKTKVNLQSPEIESRQTEEQDLEWAKHQYLSLGPSVLESFLANSVSIPVKPKGAEALYPDSITKSEGVDEESKYLRSKAMK